MAARKPPPKGSARASATGTALIVEEATPVVEETTPVAAVETQSAVELAPVNVEPPLPEAAPAVAQEISTSADLSGLQTNLRNAASKTIEHSLEAFDRLKAAGDDAAHSLEESIKVSSRAASDITAKAFEAIKANADATFAYLKALAASKSLADSISMHGEFIRKQSEAAVAHAKELAEIARKAATDSAATLHVKIKSATDSKD